MAVGIDEIQYAELDRKDGRLFLKRLRDRGAFPDRATPLSIHRVQKGMKQ